MKGGGFDENQIRQDIMENLVSAVGYHDSGKAVAGAIIGRSYGVSYGR